MMTGRFYRLCALELLFGFSVACGVEGDAEDAAGALAAQAGALTFSECAAPGAPVPAPELGEFERRILPLPEELSTWSAPRFVANTDFLVLHGRTRVGDRGVIVRVRSDGTGYRCLSCGLPESLDLGRPQAFSDGRRILVQSPQSSSQLFDHEHRHYVLTCAPSIADCRSVELDAIDGMYSEEAFQERWPAVAPDDAHIAWTRVTRDGFQMVLGELTQRKGVYRVKDARLLNARLDDGSARGYALGAAWFEIKGFADGGRTLLFASTLDQGANLDAYEMDLTTGKIRRATAHPDWDEESQVTADGRYRLVGSSRGRDVLTDVSLLPYPPLFDFASAPALTRYFLAGEARRSAKQGLWIFPREGEQRPDAGGRLLSEPNTGWFRTESIGTSSDGTQIAWSELQPGERVKRVLVGRFVGAAPSEPLPTRTTPAASWAPLIEHFEPKRLSGDYVLRGAVGGAATVSVRGGVGGGSFRVRYDDYEDAPGRVLRGTQSFEGLVALGRFEQRLEMSGCSEGYAEAALTFRGGERGGCARAELDEMSAARCY